MNLLHDAFVYSSTEEYLATLTPFILDGMGKGEPVVVISDERNRAALADVLGSDATTVHFMPSDDVYRTPHHAVASYHRALERFRSEGFSAVRAVGEVPYPNGAHEDPEWLRYEPIAHDAFASAPLHVICPYNARTLPGPLIEHARRTHPAVYADGGRRPNPAFQDPFDVLRTIPYGFRFEPAGKPDVDIAAAPQAGRAIRETVTAALDHRLAPDRTEDLTIAISELVQNGFRHGSGGVRVALWALDDAVVCAVSNDGKPITDPLAGYRPPTDLANGGMGLWLARQLADDMHIDHTTQGPVVRLAFRR